MKCIPKYYFYFSGKLLIAEVVSRFEKIGDFVRKLAKFGFVLLNKVGVLCDAFFMVANNPVSKMFNE